MVRQCRLSGRRVPGSGFCVWRSDSNRYSGSALASCLLAMPVDALLYPSNPQAGIELHHNGQSTGRPDGISRVFRISPCSMLFPVVHSVSWSGRHNVFANSVMHLMQDKAAEMTTCFADGSPGWIRTSDQPLRRRLLFPLSYRQIKSPEPLCRY